MPLAHLRASIVLLRRLLAIVKPLVKDIYGFGKVRYVHLVRGTADAAGEGTYTLGHLHLALYGILVVAEGTLELLGNLRALLRLDLKVGEGGGEEGGEVRLGCHGGNREREEKRFYSPSAS